MRFIFVICFLLGVTVIFAQQRDDFDQKTGSWYMFSGSSTAKVDVQPDYLIMSQVVERESNYPTRSDTIHILSKGKNGLILCEKKDEREMAVLRLIIEDGILQITEVQTSEDKSILQEKLDSNSALSGKELLKANYLYPEKTFFMLDKAKGLDEVTAEDLETALLSRNAYGGKLRELIRKDAELAPDGYRLNRLGRKHLNRSFIILGYNPFREVEYNFRTMFPNRPDLEELLDGF